MSTRAVNEYSFRNTHSSASINSGALTSTRTREYILVLFLGYSKCTVNACRVFSSVELVYQDELIIMKPFEDDLDCMLPRRPGFCVPTCVRTMHVLF